VHVICAFAIVFIRARDNWASVIYATWGAFFLAMFLAFIFTGLPLNQLRDPTESGDAFDTSRDVLGMMLVPVSVITLLLVLPAYVVYTRLCVHTRCHVTHKAGCYIAQHNTQHHG